MPHESYRSKHPYRCSEPGCKNTHPASNWDAKSAQKHGWFFQKDGTVWCPDHTPPWVEAWRKKRKTN